MPDLISTYRIQFNKDFTFKDCSLIVPYLKELGVVTLYASPIFEAVPGSMHGYDVTNPNRINPEIGTLEELRELSALLKAAGMNWVQDIVPNHMGYHVNNPWLMDVLRYGEESKYRSYFDIISKDLAKEPLMAPFEGDPLFEQLSSEQYPFFRLCNYQETNEGINYRRFFTVNSLICINVQYPEVFAAYHKLIKVLLDEGIFQGLRIDHVDGLADPTGYLQRLRALCGAETYIVVEKILEPGEELNLNWPVQGTTGYDYLGLVNQLFTNQKAEKKFDDFYDGLGRKQRPVEQQVILKKRAFLEDFMQGELDNLYQLLLRLAGVQGSEFKAVLSELLVRCPVYRFYSNRYPLQEAEAASLESLFKEIEVETGYKNVVSQLRRFLLYPDMETEAANSMVFFKRLMQFTGPLMAKGVEDTLMYTYNRFIGNNEVGDSPEVFGITVSEFHEQLGRRSKYWPHTMNATATHDTKRGEDARARLGVLTDIRKEWIDEVNAWSEMNREIKAGNAPDANDEYFIYQTLIATCPDDLVAERYEERLLNYIEKALRESKRRSGWEAPDLEYEAHTQDFIRYLLDPEGKFWPKFITFQQRVADLGRQASLSSLLLKHTLPGIPDTYQGTELWDLSMVDPDNRRPVDYALRHRLLQSKVRPEGPAEKLWLLHTLLRFRRDHAPLFADGTYEPLKVRGSQSDHVVAFLRRYRNQSLLVAAAVNTAVSSWEDTYIELPESILGVNKCRNILNDRPLSFEKEIELSSMFDDLKLGMLLFEIPEQRRGAGVLTHISSLPSAYGIGDFGPAASSFLSFLDACGMRYWQVLPMNPLSEEQVYSPYSATSVMAGNTLMISPELLMEEGYLGIEDLKLHQKRIRRKVSYPKANALKNDLLKKAFDQWRLNQGANRDPAFESFCEREDGWLRDYALFVLIRELQGSKPWYEWPEALRDRDGDQLQQVSAAHPDRLQELKWQQYIFFKQWRRLKREAHILGIDIIGDLPFYTALDSSDVWAGRSLFAVAPNGKVKGIAGVPPDYFNAEGQLWGMPVYNWKVMERQGYRWWMERMAKNLELYDLVRLDHFRAFLAYWEVPAGSDTAKNGSWKKGPGVKFFQTLWDKLGKLPLIAEDLGEISEDVYALRDKFGLPGMKVLQFAFGDDGASSIHAPHQFGTHNCVVYTGTHDNNTSRGWYEEETDVAVKKRLEKYTGTKVSRHNVALKLARLALGSSADLAIIPMQDILNKPAKDRMNTPASTAHNWTWRFKTRELQKGTARVFRELIVLFGR